MAQWMPTRPTMGARSFGAFPGGLNAGDWQRAPYGDTRGYARPPGLGGGYQFTPTRPYAGSASVGLDRLAQLYQNAGFGSAFGRGYPGGGYQFSQPGGGFMRSPGASFSQPGVVNDPLLDFIRRQYGGMPAAFPDRFRAL
jgi:hypothetical protein